MIVTRCRVHETAIDSTDEVTHRHEIVICIEITFAQSVADCLQSLHALYLSHENEIRDNSGVPRRFVALSDKSCGALYHAPSQNSSGVA